MNYLIELIKKENPEAESRTVEYVISYLMKEGHIVYTIQYHFDVYDFYSKALSHYESIGLQKKCAFIDTLDHFGLKKSQLYNIINEFSKK